MSVQFCDPTITCYLSGKETIQCVAHEVGVQKRGKTAIKGEEPGATWFLAISFSLRESGYIKRQRCSQIKYGSQVLLFHNSSLFQIFIPL